MKKWKFMMGIGVVLVAGMSACGARTLILISEKVEVELGEELNENVTDYVELDEKAASEAVLDLSAVDTTKVGTYPASVTYKEQTAAFEIVVKDTTAPVVEVTEEITVAAGMPLYAEDVIESITELSNEATATFEEVETDPEELAETTEELEATEAAEEVFTIGTVNCNNAFVIYPEIGEYDNVLTVADASGNETEVTLHIVVGEAPAFSGIEDLTVTVGTEKVDYLKGITAKDCNGNDITSKITCDASAVKLDTAGKYEILYTVEDEDGFQATEKATVTVTDKKGQKTSSSEDNKTSSTSSKNANTANTDKKGNAGSNSNTGNNGNTGNNSNTGNNNNASSNSNTGNNNNAGSNSNTGNNGNSGNNSNTGNGGNAGGSENTGNGGNAGGSTDTGSNGNAGGSENTGNGGNTGGGTDAGMSLPDDFTDDFAGTDIGGADDGTGLDGSSTWH